MSDLHFSHMKMLLLTCTTCNSSFLIVDVSIEVTKHRNLSVAFMQNDFVRVSSEFGNCIVSDIQVLFHTMNFIVSEITAFKTFFDICRSTVFIHLFCNLCKNFVSFDCYAEKQQDLKVVTKHYCHGRGVETSLIRQARFISPEAPQGKASCLVV